MIVRENLSHLSDISFLPADNEETSWPNFSLQLEWAGLANALSQLFLHLNEERLEFIKIRARCAPCNFLCRLYFGACLNVPQLCNIPIRFIQNTKLSQQSIIIQLFTKVILDNGLSFKNAMLIKSV